MTPEDKPCRLVHDLVKVKDGSMREPQVGWTYLRCLNCPLTVWVPVGEIYVPSVACRRKAAAN